MPFFKAQNFYILVSSSPFGVCIVESEDIPNVEPVSSDELGERTARLQPLMEDLSLDATIIMTPANRYYMGGMVQNGLIYVPVAGEPAYLVRQGYERVKEESPMERIVPFSRFSEILAIIADMGLPVPQRVGLEMDSIPVNMFQGLRKRLSGVTFEDASRILLNMRMFKSPYELRQIRKAARIVDTAFRKVPDMLREGMTEVELQAMVEYEMRLSGHPGGVRAHGWGREFTPGITLSGRTGALGSYVDTVLGGEGLSPAMPAGPSFHRTRGGVPVILDFVGCWNGYYADMTRTFGIGELPRRIVAGHGWCRELQYDIVAEIESGKTLADVTSFAFSRANKAGYGDYFMGLGDSKVSFIGHGVGLELDEYPVVFGGWNDGAKPGQVLAIEPKLIFPGLGAVGVENTWHVREDGADLLMKCITETPYYI